MENQITQLLGQLRAPTGSNIAALAQSSGNMMSKGFNQLSDTLKKVGDVKREAAVNQIISGADTTDPYAAQAQLFGQLSSIPGVSAMDALGLSAAATKSSLDKMKYSDALQQKAFENSIDYLKATKTSPKGYGMISDDLGNIYSFNKDTGDYSLVQKADANMNPKLVTLKSVVSRSPDGVETTRYVPFNKMTGQPIGGGSSFTSGTAGGMGVKYPTATDTQKDNKEALESVLSLVNAMQIPTEEQSGPIDSRVDDVKTWLNIDTPDTKAAAKFDSDLGNLVTAFGTAQVKGVLSDKDTQYIESQMPSRRYSPEVNRVRMDNIKRKIDEAVNRWNKNNPYNPIEINRGENQTTVKSTPALEDLVPLGDGLYRMPDGRIIRKKAQ